MGHHSPKEYAATAQVLLNVPTSDVPATTSVYEQLVGTQLSSNLVVTYSDLVTSALVRSGVANLLREQGVTTPGALSTSLPPASYLINITAASTSPQVAMLTANAAAQVLTDTVAGLQAGQKQPGPRINTVGQATLPTVPFSPRPTLNLVIGGLLGLVVGLGLLGGIEALDRTVRTVSQVDALLAAPLLGVVPKHGRKTVVVGAKREGSEGEPYRTLRTAVRFLDLDRPIRSILITSPMANEGKTSTAANLALALALAGERVILVDADLRRAGLGRALGIDSSVGLTSLVLGGVSTKDVLHNYAQNLLVVPSGPLPPNPSEILGSQLINNFLQELTGFADVVVIDAPPVLPVADAVALSAQVDATILILRHGMTLRSGVAATRRRLEAVGANIVGYVLNGVPRRETRDYYLDSAYDYTGSRPAEESAAAR